MKFPEYMTRQEKGANKVQERKTTKGTDGEKRRHGKPAENPGEKRKSNQGIKP